jgi:hypothetical protein
MLKIICDVCSKEITDMEFMFEATIMEMRKSYTGMEMKEVQKMDKKQVQVCRECYEKNIKNLLKI